MLGSRRNKDKKTVKNSNQQHLYRVVILIFIFMIFSVLSVFQSFSFIDDDTDVLLHEHLSETILLKNSTHIYIDIGCYDGQTVEHFIYFTPNSILYDIIIFEPDPANYQLCKRQLQKKKYENYSISIIPKVIWVRNEKVPYLINQQSKSRIFAAGTAWSKDVVQLDAIDFSSWLARLIKSNNTRLHVKISMPGSEIPLIRKLLIKDTLLLAERWDLQWTDRKNPRIRGTRIYLQSMIDSLGYSCSYYARVSEVREVYRRNGTFQDIRQHIEWQFLPEDDTYCYYIQRPTILDPIRTTRSTTKSKKV